MGEKESKEKLEQLNSDIKSTQRKIDEKKKTIETLKKSKVANIEYLRQVVQAEDILKSLKEQDNILNDELKEVQN